MLSHWVIHNKGDIFYTRYFALDIYTASLNCSKQVIFVVNLTLFILNFLWLLWDEYELVEVCCIQQFSSHV